MPPLSRRSRRFPWGRRSPTWVLWACLCLVASRSSAVNVEAPGGGAPATPFPIAVADEGVLLAPAQKKLNFTGAGVTCAVNGPQARIDCTIPGGGGPGGTPIVLDLGDLPPDESAALAEIATTGDANGIFTEPIADKLLIDLTKDWPKADVADDVTCVGCVADAELASVFLKSPIGLGDLPDAAPADLCLRSGDAGNPAYEPCQPLIVVTDAPYLADNTGAGDATAAIRAAIAALPATGGQILFPCGTYSVTSPTPGATAALSVNTSGVTLRGVSRSCATIKLANGSDDIRLLAVGDSGAPTITGFTVRDLTFDGNGANWGATAGRGHNAITRGSQGTVNNTLIDNVRFTGFFKDSITNTSVISWGANSWNGLTLRDLILEGNRSLGLNLFCSAGTCGNFTIQDIRIDNTGAVHTNPFDERQNILIGATVTGGGKISNVQCATTCSGVCVAIAAPSVTLANSFANGCKGDQFIATGAAARNVSITGCVATNGQDGGFGFEAAPGTDGPRDVTFTGNVARNNTVAGLYVVNTKNAQIANNVFDGNCTGGIAANTCTGVYVVGEAGHTSTNVQLVENSYIDTQGGPTQKYGAALVTTSTDGVRIQGGDFSGNTVAGYRLDAATNTRITGYTGGSFSLANAPTYSVSGTNPPGIAFASLGTPQNGSMVYCSDCTMGTPCAGGGTGALAKRLNGAWDCRAIGTLVDADIPNSITIDLATAATALQNDPTDCGANTFAQSIVANGNLTCATPVLGTDTNGNYVASATANQGLLLTGTEGASLGLIDCAANEVLKRNAGDTQWVCASDLTGGGGTIVVQEDDANVDATAATIDFTEPDATLVTSAPAGEANVDMTKYVIQTGRAAGQGIIGSTAGGNIAIAANSANTGIVQLSGNEVDFTAAAVAPQLRFYETAAGGSNYVALKAPDTLTPSWTLTLPPDDGDASECLQTNGSGTTTWEPCGGDAVSVNGSAATDANFLDGNGIALTLDTAPTPDTITPNLRGMQVASATACGSTSSSGSAAETEIAAATTAGKGYLIPSGCKIVLDSPGGGANAVDIPAGAKLYCQDATAGFAALAQRCSGGTYPGAECTGSGQCTGGGTCVDQFGGSNRFAPTAATTYTMLKDTASGVGIEVHNCGFWTYQAGPYQRVVNGGNAGNPCRSECKAAAALPGWACDADADCGGGAGDCVHLADASGGTCSGAPGSASGDATAKINVLDFARTVGVVLDHVIVYDQFKGDFAAKVGNNAYITNSNLAAEIGGCSNPPGYTGIVSGQCTTSLGGNCCYTAFASGLVSTPPTQPTTAVVDGLVTGTNPVVRDSQARGTTTAFNLGGSGAVGTNVLTGSEIWPVSAVGPGTTGAGILATGASFIGRNTSGATASGTVVIKTVPSGGVTVAKVTGNHIAGAVGGTAIRMEGANSRASENFIVTTTSTGVAVVGDDITLENNRIATDSGTGIDVTGTRVNISTNNLSSATGNILHIPAGGGHRIIGNTSIINTGGAFITPSLKPVHVLLDGTSTAPTQQTFVGNYYQGGWRGFDQGTVGLGLTNTNIANNRFVAVNGASSALGGAGVQHVGNYTNGSGNVTVCDPSCNTTPGRPCNNDGDCGTCTSTNKCVPEPAVWIGSPNSAGGGSTAHWAALDNIWYSGQTWGQCGGTTTNAGQLCETAGNTCAGGAVCSGTPATCQTGTESGKRCCAGGAPTCSVRQPWSGIRAAAAAGSGHTEMSIAGNHIFTGLSANFIGIDLQAPGVTADPDITNASIQGNVIFTQGTSATNATGIAFARGAANARVAVASNHIFNVTNKITGTKGTFGPVSLLPRTTVLLADQTTNSTTFIDVTDGTTPVAVSLEANGLYYFNCEATFQSSVVTTGIGFAVSLGGVAPTTINYITRLPTISVETGAGTDTMTEQEGHADDATDANSIGVGNTGFPYTAAVRGNIVMGANAATLTLRVKAENANNVTVKKGTQCVVTELPL